MNPVQQRQRHTVIAQLNADLETVLDGLHREMVARDTAIADSTVELLKRERATRREVIAAINLTIAKSLAAQTAFRERRFWSRLNWIFTGR